MSSQTFELIVASLSIATAVAFALLPFLLSYRPVALAAPWDIILAILWGVAFGLMKSIFLRIHHDNDDKPIISGKENVAEFWAHWNTMVRSSYINLAGLILSLISGIMGLVLFFIGRRISGGGRSKASYP